MPLRWTRELLDLLADCEVTPFKSSGPGGQKKNKTESSVRVVHRPSGIVRIATESRSQSANKLRALERIQETLIARARKPKPRVATKPSAASEARRLAEKKEGGGQAAAETDPRRLSQRLRSAKADDPGLDGRRRTGDPGEISARRQFSTARVLPVPLPEPETIDRTSRE